MCCTTAKLDKYKKTNSFVVVTGGSDGIGLEICDQMAAKGFNVYMISRSEDKMKAKIAELSEKHGSLIQFRYIVADFCKLKSIEEYKTTIADKLEGVDIAMLFLNAGFAQVGVFDDLHPSDVSRLVDVNVVQVIYTCKVLLKQMIARQHPGAIVITSSAAAMDALPGLTTYCATKSFVSYLGIGLNTELK